MHRAARRHPARLVRDGALTSGAVRGLPVACRTPGARAARRTCAARRRVIVVFVEVWRSVAKRATFACDPHDPRPKRSPVPDRHAAAGARVAFRGRRAAQERAAPGDAEAGASHVGERRDGFSRFEPRRARAGVLRDAARIERGRRAIAERRPARHCVAEERTHGRDRSARVTLADARSAIDFVRRATSAMPRFMGHSCAIYRAVLGAVEAPRA